MLKWECLEFYRFLFVTVDRTLANIHHKVAALPSAQAYSHADIGLSISIHVDQIIEARNRCDCTSYYYRNNIIIL